MQILLDFQASHPYLWILIIGALILGVTAIIEHIVYRLIRRVCTSDNIDLPSSSIFINIARVAIWTFGISVCAKTCFNYDVTALIAALGVGGIALSLGLQDTIANLFGGLQISLSRIVKPGDYFEMDGMPSRVTDVTWRHTTLKDAAGTEYLVPNSLMYKNMLIRSGGSGWVAVPVLIDPLSDIDAFTQEILEALQVPLAYALGPGGMSVQLKGIVVGGLSVAINADILRESMSASVAIDTIMRTIDPVLKRYAPK